MQRHRELSEIIGFSVSFFSSPNVVLICRLETRLVNDFLRQWSCFLLALCLLCSDSQDFIFSDITSKKVWYCQGKEIFQGRPCSTKKVSSLYLRHRPWPSGLNLFVLHRCTFTRPGHRCQQIQEINKAVSPWACTPALNREPPPHEASHKMHPFGSLKDDDKIWIKKKNTLFMFIFKILFQIFKCLNTFLFFISGKDDVCGSGLLRRWRYSLYRGIIL